MIIKILTLFPEMFENFLQCSIVGRAINGKAIDVTLINIRDFTDDKHNTADDYPYGGGAGMVMKPEPLYRAIMYAKNGKKIPVIYFSPQGKRLNQQVVNDYTKVEEVILLCGHYKGIDQRIRKRFVDYEISIGDYVISGGELAAMVFVDSVARLQEGVLNNIDSALTDSYQNNLLDAPYYTRPAEFMGMKVPEVLISGNHQKIAEWRAKKAYEITKVRRPDLLNEES